MPVDSFYKSISDNIERIIKDVNFNLSLLHPSIEGFSYQELPLIESKIKKAIALHENRVKIISIDVFAYEEKIIFNLNLEASYSIELDIQDNDEPLIYNGLRSYIKYYYYT